MRTKLNVIFNLVGTPKLVNYASKEIKNIISNNYMFLLDKQFKIEILNKHHEFDLTHNTNITIITSNADIIINNCDIMPVDDLIKLNKSIIYLSDRKWFPVVLYINSNNNYPKDYQRSLEKKHIIDHIYDLDTSDDSKKNNIRVFLK